MEDPVTGDPLRRHIEAQGAELGGGSSRHSNSGQWDHAPDLRPPYDPDRPSRTHSMTDREVRACAVQYVAAVQASSREPLSYDWIVGTLKWIEHYILTGEMRK
jgi:hypothetical protein